MPFTHQSNRLVRASLFCAALAAIAVALLFARPAATPGPALRDFEAYYAAGQAWLHGGDPYSTQIWTYERAVPGVDAARYEFLPFIGPPHGIALWGLLALCGYPIAAAVWWAICAAGGILALRACTTLAGARVGLREFLMLLPLGVAFAPLTSALALGQVALPAFAACMLALLAAENAALPAAALLIVAALQPNVALGFLAALGRAAARRAVAIGALVTLAAALIFSLHGDGLAGYLRALGEHRAAERSGAIQFTPAAVFTGLGMSEQSAGLLGLFLALVAAAATAIVLLRARARPAFGAALICAALPFVVPFVHEHDLIVALLPIAYCMLRLRGRAAIIAAGASVLVAVDWLGLAQRPSGLLQSALLAFAFAIAFAQQSREPRALVAALAPLALVFGLGLYAQSHAAPVWPDALPADFALPPGMHPAAAWETEQRAAGLFAVNPFWALLRALSLAGSAGLWLALTVVRQAHHDKRGPSSSRLRSGAR